MCLALILATPLSSVSADDEQAIISPSPEIEIETITIEIRSRMFVPQRVHVHHDRKTMLRFRNHDTELHTVAAKEIFIIADLNIGGNGAQEFGPEGLKRVIVPPEGIIEVQFTPTRTGTFSYLCDMPGHDMKGVVVVE
jgi:plastocyanin